MKEILIIRLSSIGDVMHCTPVARSLKRAWPDCKITWLVGEVAADLLLENPYIDQIMVWSREKFDKYLKNLEISKAVTLLGSLRQNLSHHTFDAVLDIHGLFLTGMIARMVKTDRRIGMSQARELNPWFMTETAKPVGRHIIDRYLGVLVPLGITDVSRKMTLKIPEKERQLAENHLSNAGIFPQEKFVVFVPGTTWPTKNWPADSFVQVAKMIGGDFKIVLCGGKGETLVGKYIQEQADVRIINTIGKTGLLEMAGIIQRAAVVVTGDTGPLYIAAALAIPTVSIFGPTDPVVYAPPGWEKGVLVRRQSCSFCHKTQCRHGRADCISSVTPEEVAGVIYRLME